VESAAQYLNAQIKVVQDQSKVIGIEHTVVLAALNMANELISDQPMEVDEVVINRVRGLRQRIAAAISED
jgi:cell division protein ZapA (FtsZ GTPase activity inhibitor)